ncbi:MAG: type II toxin-antitoxin system PemK/MazF family toxin [Caulobacter sp.]|nr:type II toxin-antitoxin system PemK/MazF family toxin [Caulobacter sp.]
MTSYRPGDLIKVPFPYTDRSARQRRPAFVAAAGDLLSRHGLLWVIMVTSAENRGWPGDVGISDYAAAGLPAPSLIRCAKIATIEARDAEPLGRAAEDDIRVVLDRLRARLAG